MADSNSRSPLSTKSSFVCHSSRQTEEILLLLGDLCHKKSLISTTSSKECNSEFVICYGVTHTSEYPVVLASHVAQRTFHVSLRYLLKIVSYAKLSIHTLHFSHSWTMGNSTDFSAKPSLRISAVSGIHP